MSLTKGPLRGIKPKLMASIKHWNAKLTEIELDTLSTLFHL